MRFIIGEHDGDEVPIERGNFRAYFYWEEDGAEHHRSYSITDLEAHIRRCRSKGQPTMKLEAALRRLRAVNGR
jgi:hypothetical protein